MNNKQHLFWSMTWPLFSLPPPPPTPTATNNKHSWTQKALQIIPNISCISFTFNRIGSLCVCLSEIDGLGQLTSDDLWGLMLLHNKCKQFQKVTLRRSFLPYSFVHHRNNIWNFTIYIYYDVLTLLNSFPLSNLTKISWMGPTLFGWLWALDAVGTQM